MEGCRYWQEKYKVYETTDQASMDRRTDEFQSFLHFREASVRPHGLVGFNPDGRTGGRTDGGTHGLGRCLNRVRVRISIKNRIRIRTTIRIGIRAQRCILGTVSESCVAFRPS